MAIKLIALDLDGTLLSGDKRISERNMNALTAASGKGIHIVVSTGRFYRGMPEAIRNLPFLRYVISINGAEVYDAVEDKVLRRAELPHEQADLLFAYMDTLPVIYDCYQDSWGYMDRRSYEKIEEFIDVAATNSMIKQTRTAVDNLRQFIADRGRPVQKTQMFFKDIELRKKTLSYMPALFPDTQITSSVINNIELNSLDGNKGAALLFLCGYLGIDISETMAFGDGTNDISMLRNAGTGVAMENATEDVKAVASCVTCSNDEDGVAVMIEKLALD